MQKFGLREAFKKGPNLNSILCKNKGKLMLNSYPGVYKLKCPCGSVYNGETKKKPQNDLLHPKTLSIKNRYYDREVRESLEIDMAVVKYGQEKVLNRDNGNFVKTNAWKPLFRKIKTLH